MKIAVCIKQVPEREDCGMDPEQGVLVREGSMRLNPCDGYALETALRLAGECGETTAFTMGPPSAEAVLRDALAMGVEKAYLVSDSAFAGADVLATSYTLAEAIRLHGPFDAVVCGKQTTDGDTAQVGAALAAWLGWEYLGGIKAVSLQENGAVRVSQLRSGGVCGMETTFPFVMAVEQNIFTPRIPTLKMRLQAGKKDLEVISLKHMRDRCPEHYGLRGSPTRVVRIYSPARKKRGSVTPMDGAAAADVLRNVIKEQWKKGGAHDNITG
ncbi:electron transfer flavoprotein subunit beta/FixA family protein [Clostridium sp. AN503]|uniref:electron transfer flavoprotein subunit beta/FixA family protein n=1 Tax=Clostridium sp. AN503 TaxID=3160598 RepID=UPI003459B03B